jgi:hypothetical protein
MDSAAERQSPGPSKLHAIPHWNHSAHFDAAPWTDLSRSRERHRD